MIRALFFDAFDRKWTLPIAVISPNIFAEVESDHPVPHQATLQTVEVSRLFLGSEPIRGANPEVFKYRLKLDEANEAFAFAGIFYELFELYAYSPRAMAAQAV